MAEAVKVPSFGESIAEVEIESWNKREGEPVALDEPLCTLASDKASLELPAPAAGVLRRILKQAGSVVQPGEVIAEIETDGAASTGAPAAAQPAAAPAAERAAAPAAKPAPAAPAADRAQAAPPPPAPAGPAVRQLLARHGLEPSQIEGTGPRGRITPADVERHLAARAAGAAAPAAARPERLVRMTPIRRRIAERLLEAKRTTAMLTTFNEIDMSAVIALRKRYQDAFRSRYGIKLGFMSFFVKASIEALKAFPAINAEIRGEQIAYKDYYDIGIAVGTGKGLTVPVLRDADQLSFAEIETRIADFAQRAEQGKLQLEELQGGTFTITNGGIYGSLLSTPILNPPQSGILGMHKIEERPIALEGQVVIRPMMYVALSYDHRIVDGREAVQFLVRIKECIEDPSRMLIEV